MSHDEDEEFKERVAQEQRIWAIAKKRFGQNIDVNVRASDPLLWQIQTYPNGKIIAHGWIDEKTGKPVVKTTREMVAKDVSGVGDLTAEIKRLLK